MGRPVLLLRLEGVWQSWGERSRWDVRDTGNEPTKSGIVGLLGCALGYPMRDLRLETELDAGLRFGVRTESPGRVVQDYQTITDFLPTADGSFRHSGVSTAKSLGKLLNDPDATPATIISPRYYLEDASFLVALEQRDGYEGLAEKCATALKSPKWPVFLGRKACVPTRPVMEALTHEYDDVRHALEYYPWSWLKANGECRAKCGIELAVMIESADGDHWRQDAVRINQARGYEFRRASVFSVPAPSGGES